MKTETRDKVASDWACACLRKPPRVHSREFTSLCSTARGLSDNLRAINATPKPLVINLGSLPSLSLTLLMLFTVAVSTFGQVTVSPVAVTTAIPSFNEIVTPGNLINQSGVTTPFTSGVTPFDTYFSNPSQTFATSGNGGTNNWQSDTAFDLGYQGYLDFDLGAIYQIDQLAIWNRSLSNVTVKILTDLSGTEQVAGSFTLVDRQNFTFSYPVEILKFNTSFVGRYVRLEINGVYPFQGFDFGNASAGEVVVSALPAFPAPPTLSIAIQTNGDVKLPFTGSLQTSLTSDGMFINRPGNPASPLTLSKVSLLPREFFRAFAD
jgi:hypothetical protein